MISSGPNTPESSLKEICDKGRQETSAGACAGWQIHTEIILQENCVKEMIFAKQEAQKETNQVLTVL